MHAQQNELPLLLIQTGQPPERILAEHGPFSAMIQRIGRIPDDRLLVVDAQGGEALPPPEAVACAVITGSAAMVSDREDWSERTAAWIKDAFEQRLPMFGICYGHQLMAHALGGEVGYHPQGREVGTHDIQLQPIDAATTPSPGFPAHLIHQQTVRTVPRQARVAAANDHDPHQLLHYGDDIWSTQFHPEFDALIMRDYLMVFRDQLLKESFDVDALLDAVQPTPQANALLRDFVERRLTAAAPRPAQR